MIKSRLLEFSILGWFLVPPIIELSDWLKTTEDIDDNDDNDDIVDKVVRNSGFDFISRNQKCPHLQIFCQRNYIFTSFLCVFLQ